MRGRSAIGSSERIAAQALEHVVFPPLHEKNDGEGPSQATSGNTQHAPATSPPHWFGNTSRAQNPPLSHGVVVSHAFGLRHGPISRVAEMPAF